MGQSQVERGDEMSCGTELTSVSPGFCQLPTSQAGTVKGCDADRCGRQARWGRGLCCRPEPRQYKWPGTPPVLVSLQDMGPCLGSGSTAYLHPFPLPYPLTGCEFMQGNNVLARQCISQPSLWGGLPKRFQKRSLRLPSAVPFVPWAVDCSCTHGRKQKAGSGVSTGATEPVF